MSTLKTVSVIHPSGSVTNISNDSSGNVTIGNNLTVTGTTTLTGSLGNITTGTINSGAITSSGTVSGTALTSSGTVTASTGVLYPLVSATSQASTSGTSIDFGSIPSWVKRITVMFAGVSTSGSSPVLCRIGTGGTGGIITTGYVSANGLASSTGATGTSSTAGFLMDAGSVGATTVRGGHATLTLVGSNQWVFHVVMGWGTGSTMGGGYASLSGALDIVRLTTVNGTDTFDAGNINILYE